MAADFDPHETVELFPPPPPAAPDHEKLIAALADIHAEASTSAATRPDEDLRQALVRCWKLADAAIRQARGY